LTIGLKYDNIPSVNNINREPGDIPLIETDPNAAGIADGLALVAPNNTMANALDIQLPKKDIFIEKIEFGYSPEDELKIRSKNPYPFKDADYVYGASRQLNPDRDVASWTIDWALRSKASDYAKGYAQGLEQFLNEHGYEHLDDFKDSGQLNLESDGSLVGVSRGLDWRNNRHIGSFDEVDGVRDYNLGHGIRTGVIAALLKDYGLSLASFEAPSSQKALAFMGYGSRGELFFLLGEDLEAIDVVNLSASYKLGLRIWLMDMGIEEMEGLEVDRIIGRNLTAFKYGLEGKDENDSSVQAVINPTTPIHRAVYSFSTDFPVSGEITPGKISDDDLYTKNPESSDFQTKDSRESEFERYIISKRYDLDIPLKKYNKISPFYNGSRWSLSASDLGFRGRTLVPESPVKPFLTPKGSARDAYELGLRAKTQIDARNTTSESDQLEA